MNWLDRFHVGSRRKVAWRPGLPWLLFAMCLFLLYPIFFPNMRDLGPFDETAYIASGRALVGGSLPSLAYAPLVAAFYAVIYLPVVGSSWWLLISASVGRILLFALLWVSMYQVAKRMESFVPPAAVLGLLMITPIVSPLMRFPSDALFAAMSAFALGALLAYLQRGEIRHAFATSLFLGLGALARCDGLVLFPIALVLAITARWPRDSAPDSLRKLGALSIPLLLLCGGYVAMRGLLTGDFSTGVAGRSYIAFEQGHALVYHADVGNATVETQYEAARVFGSGEANDYSVLRAIRRNPQAFADRLRRIVTGVPSNLLTAYGKRVAAPLFLLALRGLLELIRRRAWAVLAVLLLWPAHLLVYFLTFFRSGYFLLPFHVMLISAGIGANGLVERLDDRRERTGWTVVLLAAGLYGIVDDKLAIYAGTALLLIGLWVLWLTSRQGLGSQAAKVVGFLALLSIGLLIRPAFPSPNIPSWGEDSLDKAVLFLEDHLQPGDRVISAAPGYALAARMTPFGFDRRLRDLESSEQLLEWLVQQRIRAILWDDGFARQEPQIGAMVESLIGSGLTMAFREDPGDVRILLVVFR